jgi:formylglycine-generating enzyme required for sulfatase activity
MRTLLIAATLCFLPVVNLAQKASVTFRNGGSNPASYDAVTLPALGANYVGEVDLGGTGHSLAGLAGYPAPLSLMMPGGQTLLIDIGGPGGELLHKALCAGPLATFTVAIPLDVTLAGFSVSTQAYHVGGVQPFALSNAQDLILGWGCGEMAPVAAGAYDMGDHHDGMSWCLPVHTVNLDAFWIAVHETTNAQYCDYLNSAHSQGLIEVTGGVVYKHADSEPYCDTNAYDAESRIHWDGSVFTVTAGKEDHPMVEVSWYGAVAYANWCSAREGLTPCYDLGTWACTFGADGYRLPTEAEWEKAARGGEHSPFYRYPWGDGIDGSKANYWISGDAYETGPLPQTTPVGYFDGTQTPPGSDMANGYGLYDMSGNVGEWCHEWYSGTYYGSSPYDNPEGPPSGQYRVVRGGDWNAFTSYLRTAYRNINEPLDRNRNLGFRIVARR